MGTHSPAPALLWSGTGPRGGQLATAAPTPEHPEEAADHPDDEDDLHQLPDETDHEVQGGERDHDADHAYTDHQGSIEHPEP